MPFSLKRTLHIFTKTKNGGIQQVIVKDRTDTGQIKLIREHLSKISKEFAQGDFSVPASIHGRDMPGLKEKQKPRHGHIKIQYKEIPKRAQIKYRSENPALIDSIHRWFEVQTADHNSAVSGPSDQDSH